MSNLEKYLALDVETEGSKELNINALDWMDDRVKLRGLGYWGLNTNGWITDPDEIKSFLEEHSNYRFVFHHGTYDQKILYKHINVWTPSFFDTRLAAALLPERPTKLSLDRVAVFHGVAPTSWKEDFIEDTSVIPDDILGEYCLVDVKYTFALLQKLAKDLEENNLVSFFCNFQMPLANLLARTEYQGFTLDKEKLPIHRKYWTERANEKYENLRADQEDFIIKYEKERIQEKIDSLKKEPNEAQLAKYREKFKFNCNSQEQVLALCSANKLVPKNWRGKITTDKPTLESYVKQHPFLKYILDYRSSLKMIDYLDKWNEAAKFTGRVHSNYNLDTVRTGRLSSSGPNLQNVKTGKTRELFISSPGYSLVVVDYAQIEPRLVAHLSGDDTFIKVFTEGEDFYSRLIKVILDLPYTPQEIYDNYPDLRKVGKTTGLSILYGVGPRALAVRLSKVAGKYVPYTKAQSIIEKYYEGFPGLVRYKKELVNEYAKNKRLTNMWGRPVYLKEDQLDHLGVNAVVQGSASDLNCRAAMYVDNDIKNNNLDARLLAMVHDETIWEVRDTSVDIFKEMLHNNMVNKFKLKVPLSIEASVGSNWGVK